MPELPEVSIGEHYAQMQRDTHVWHKQSAYGLSQIGKSREAACFLCPPLAEWPDADAFEQSDLNNQSLSMRGGPDHAIDQ